VKSDGFRAAAEGKDFSAIEELFAEDATFRSPVVFKQYEGRDTIAMILRAVAEVSDDFRYTDQVENGDTAVLVFEARVGDRELNGVDILHFDAEGKIEKMMVMVRPMSGLQALAQAMEQRLAAATDSG
jgi:SnoaL-like domain